MSDRITVIGNIATEPEQRRTGTGVPVTSFRLASTQRHRDQQSGEWVDGATNWYRISVFRTLGENAFASLRKGQRVLVDGRLRLREWEANGKKGTEVEIDADAIGPDLKWGTAVFHRKAAGEASASGQPADEPDWSVPGSTGSNAPEGGDGAWVAAGAAGEAGPTPF
ncbi:single-stranded DNA-binding protein [Microbacterium oleivorans]|uniref:Single-stranded DNA-binding protein n=1 Tax=Microbacterium oleivorans TaxID=273677 RepID=A0A7D5IP10_9MICO|nr:single-stranded DNA-binding protein [Microbacterium oleivorans]QLD10401.1 single-stranded DNA-binding protein [Microbacterium oleivorans]